MIIEKRARTFRLLELVCRAASRKGTPLALTAGDSIHQFLNKAILEDDASVEQQNGDIVELVKAELCQDQTHLCLLFHRVRPNAPDPIYRKSKHRKIALRTTGREEEEDQAYSTHLVIDINAISVGVYRMALEQVPGLSAGVVVGVLKYIMKDVRYECLDDKGKKLQTRTIISCDGYASESLENALKGGSITFVQMSRDPDDAFQADKSYSPSKQKMSLRVNNPITLKDFGDRVKKILRLSNDSGFDDVRVKIEFEDERKARSLQLVNDDLGRELLFIRSKTYNFSVDLDVCYAELNEQVVGVAKNYVSQK